MLSNSKGVLYPQVNDLRTGEPIPFPTGELNSIPLESDRVPWTDVERDAFKTEWEARGYPEPLGG